MDRRWRTWKYSHMSSTGLHVAWSLVGCHAPVDKPHMGHTKEVEGETKGEDRKVRHDIGRWIYWKEQKVGEHRK